MCCVLQQPYLVVQESDVEFWADYSDTETSSDAELGDAVSDIQLDSCSGGQLFGGILFTVGDRCESSGQFIIIYFCMFKILIMKEVCGARHQWWAQFASETTCMYKNKNKTTTKNIYNTSRH